VASSRGSQFRGRVVVTGLGIVSPIGNSVEAAWDALVTGRSGTGPITRFDAAAFASRVAAEVRDFDPRARLGAKEARRTDRFVHFAVAAAQDALADSGFAIDERSAPRVGVLMGTALGGIETAEREIGTLITRGPDRVSPFFIPMYLADMGSGYVSIALGARGPNFATLSACASAAHAIGESAEIIRRGDADVMLAGGAEAAVTPASVAGFASLGALSTRNDDPETASRPFDATRDGFVVGEGGAVLVLESLEHALDRAARILAEVSGYAATADAGHITQPAHDGAGAAAAMAGAIRRAGIEPAAVDYVNAHGTSTPLNDRFETLAIKRTFGARVPAVSSTKALTGHLLGAAGAVEAVATILALRHGVIPPTWHLRVPDPDCDLDFVANRPRSQSIEHALSNSFGFGGHNASLLFSRYVDDRGEQTF